MIGVSYQMNQEHHRALMRQAYQVPVENPTGTGDALDQVGQLVRECRKTLGCEPVEVFISPSRQINAYTFGLSSPKVIVLFEPMLQIMDADELKFVIGHEMGHVIFGHTWLNTLLGGMAGMPASIGAAIIFTFAFRWWNRACEYSADRAGLAACGNLTKGISALAQLVVGDINTASELQRALAVIDRQDDSLDQILGEALSDHPMIAKRIKALQDYNR
jgi:Zn-dependent protease with chaperone function